MWPSLSMMAEVIAAEPPAGSISPLSWVIIIALAAVCGAVIPALWYRGNKIQDAMYEDLKACNAKREKTEEDVLGLMKVLRVQMEKSKGGRPG